MNNKEPLLTLTEIAVLLGVLAVMVAALDSLVRVFV